MRPLSAGQNLSMQQLKSWVTRRENITLIEVPRPDLYLSSVDGEIVFGGKIDVYRVV